MNSVTDTPHLSVENPRKPFPWKSHAMLSFLFIAGNLAVQIQNYFDGRRFEILSAFSPQIWVILFLSIIGLALFIGMIQGLYQVIRRRDPWKKSGRLVLPFAVALGIAWLPIPGFLEAAAGAIREKASSADLTALASSVVNSPPAWIKDESVGGFQPDKIKWMSSTSPLDRLGLGKYAFVDLKPGTLRFTWGSSLSQRWGLAISATPGTKPLLPDDVVKAISVYPEVWVYTLIDY